MDIIHLPFEETFQIKLNNDIITLVVYRTNEYGNIKFGIEAPRTVKVNREEIYNALKQKQSEPVLEISAG